MPVTVRRVENIALPVLTDAVAAEVRLTEVSATADAHPVAAAELATLDVCGTATALGLAGLDRGVGPPAPPPAPDVIVRLIDSMTGAARLGRHAVLSAHRQLATNLPPAHKGRFRTRKVVVASRADGSPLRYIPPPPAAVPGLVDDLLTLCARTDTPPLAAAAVAFAQFVRIHPFEDANGRTGRLLLAVVLRRRLGLRFVAPVGLVVCANRKTLHDALGRYAEGDVSGWVKYVAARAVEAADAATATISGRPLCETDVDARLGRVAARGAGG